MSHYSGAHTKKARSAPARWRIEFDRIGRVHNAAALQVPDVDADAIAAAVYLYARRFLLSRDVEVTVDLANRKGTIHCGFQTGGTFTLTDLPHSPVANAEAASGVNER